MADEPNDGKMFWIVAVVLIAGFLLSVRTDSPVLLPRPDDRKRIFPAPSPAPEPKRPC